MTTPVMILCLRSQPRAQLRSLWLRPPRHSTSIMRVTSTGACLGFQAEATGAPPLGTTCGTGTRFRDSVVSRGSGSFLQASLGDAREDYLRNRASCASEGRGVREFWAEDEEQCFDVVRRPIRSGEDRLLEAVCVMMDVSCVMML